MAYVLNQTHPLFYIAYHLRVIFIFVSILVKKYIYFNDTQKLCQSTRIISSILPLGPQSLKYLLCAHLQEKYAKSLSRFLVLELNIE